MIRLIANGAKKELAENHAHGVQRNQIGSGRRREAYIPREGTQIELHRTKPQIQHDQRQAGNPKHCRTQNLSAGPLPLGGQVVG